MSAVRVFNPLKFELNTFSLIIGGRGSGKTTLVFDLMYYLKDRIDIVVAFVKTKPVAKKLKKYIPSRLIHIGDLNLETLTRLMETCNRFSENVEKPLQLLLFVDDMAYDKKLINNNTMNEIAFNGRHYKMTVIMTLQYINQLVPAIRNNTSYCFIFKPERGIEKIHKEFFSMYGPLNEFRKLVTEKTSDHGVLCYEQGKEKPVTHYRANPSITSNFRISRPVFFYLSKIADQIEKKLIRESQLMQKRINETSSLTAGK